MKMKVIMGNSQNMKELKNESVHLVAQVPRPYFNAPFDYPDLFEKTAVFSSGIKCKTSMHLSSGLSVRELAAIASISSKSYFNANA